MNERDQPTMQGLPDGGAELSVVLRLRWDDVAALGREASRLAEQRGTPVSLDEAAGHRLRTWSSVANGSDDRSRTTPSEPAPAQTPASAPTSTSAPPSASAAAIAAAPAVDRARSQVAGRLSEASPVAPVSASLARHAQAPAAAGGRLGDASAATGQSLPGVAPGPGGTGLAERGEPSC